VEDNIQAEPNKLEDPSTQDGKAKLRAYKIVCAKLGLVMCAYFICRLLGGLAAGWIVGLSSAIGGVTAYIIGVIVTVVFVYVIPLLFAVMLFKSARRYRNNGGLRALYKKPNRLARAFGTFPAMYGLGYGVALLTLLVSYLLSRLTAGGANIDDILRPTTLDPSSTLAGALTLLVLMVVIAPVFEEILARGIIYDELKPYGCGMAIIISSVLFGLMHGSLNMLFYTTALGFALGYVRYATDSLYVVTILHAIINSIAAGLLFISALTEIIYEESRLLNTVYSIYILAMFILIAVGLIAFILRIPVIRKYKIENAWGEIGAGRKTALFFLSVPVIIMLVLAINEFANNWLLGLII
jgi:membrane protease YdiL (CAAX protease family)